jgi:lipopolysaccharide transport system ATP-binding protein
MQPIITVENLGKRYRLGPRERYRTLRDSLVETAMSPVRGLASLFSGNRNGNGSEEHVWALKDVSFEVAAGDVVGLIGSNGAGKSTLLKILSRITEPTLGCARLYGRVGSLLEVGTGFHPELTGRENIFLSGAILGMRRAEIARKFDEIVAFADIEQFIDTPVKRYSSGMYVRLAFAVAAHLEPEILLVDEVLAVGDASFQKKCLGKMGDIARAGRTVLFVSHNMTSIESLCTSCLLIKSGKVEAKGIPTEIVGRYLANERNSDSGSRSLRHHQGRRAGSIGAMTMVELQTDGETIDGAIRMGSPLSINVSYSAERPLRPVVGVAVRTIQGAPVFAVSERYCNQLASCESAQRGKVVCTLDELPLMPGTYVIDLYFGDAGNDFDRISDAISFEVLPADLYGTGHLAPSAYGPLFCSPNWTLLCDPGDSQAQYA